MTGSVPAVRCLLATDVGGTKTLVALAETHENRPRIVHERVYASQQYSGLEPVLRDFLSDPQAAPRADAIAAACCSVAGPVEGEASTLTNLAWRLSAASIAGAFGFGKVRLINDFEAAGLGIASLTAEDLATLQTGTPVPRGMRLVLGAGTGLGVAVLAWHGDGYVVHPSEGGHTDFAPLDETQDALLQYLRRSFGRVSYERAVSGPGLMRLFSLLEESGAGVPSKPLLEAIQRQDPAEAIAEFAASRLDPLAVHALDLFVAIYGAFAGNMALTVLARGGVYIAGGIAPKIVTRLQEGGFMRAFTDKGRFSALLATVPVHVVMNPKVGLFGALAAAQRLI